MKIGERINPYNLFVGSFIPNWLLKRPEVSMAAKLTYARLGQYAGKDGEAFPKIETLAEELGASKSTVERALLELKKAGLIESHQRGLTQSNRYFFLSHRWMSGKLDTSNQTVPDTSNLTVQEPNDLTVHLKRISEENQLKIPPDPSSNPAQGAGTPAAWPKVKPKDPEQWSYSGPPLVDALPRARGGRQ